MEVFLEESAADPDVEAVAAGLKVAEEHGMVVEVVCWAMKALKANPAMSIEEAINEGLYEWDC